MTPYFQAVLWAVLVAADVVILWNVVDQIAGNDTGGNHWPGNKE